MLTFLNAFKDIFIFPGHILKASLVLLQLLLKLKKMMQFDEKAQPHLKSIHDQLCPFFVRVVHESLVFFSVK